MNLDDYDFLPTQTVIPAPSAMIETLRAIGYHLETAIADILDNSIAAQARRVDLQFNWAEQNSTIYIVDDGVGMTNAGIIEAMRAGSKNPLEVREGKDLGRFGLGLKTASFSQCRKLTVLSKQQGGEIHFWTWDLDFVQQVNEWKIVSQQPSPQYLKILESRPSGTLVLWEKIDRLRNLPHDSDKRNAFKVAEEYVSKHLEMIFHRYLEQEEIHIFTNGRKLITWDPFFTNFKGILPHPIERLGSSSIQMQGFVLPHKSKFLEANQPLIDIEDRNAQQGFYIYRNNRLLVSGGWMNLFKREEKYKLARIQIDLPNNLDQEWQIDIRKSKAIYPVLFKKQLNRYAKRIREEAANVFEHRNTPFDSTGLTVEEQQGLFGELSFLRTLLLATQNKEVVSEQILQSWLGSSKHRHDFHFQHWGVEIKTTTPKKDFKIRINNENQLDDEGLDFLGLCFYILSPQSKGGKTLNDMVNSLAEWFEKPNLIKIFHQKLGDMGYHKQHAPLYEDTQYTIKQIYYYQVKDDFPRLIRSTLPLGAMEVKYVVALSECQKYLITEETLLTSLYF